MQHTALHQNTGPDRKYMITPIIISMTSYPPRINCVARAFAGIFLSAVDKAQYHCVLTLSEIEFPHKMNDLPCALRNMAKMGLIEIIWCPDNIKSHKKLMPTLAKYPNHPILVIDDDTYRTGKWLQTFIDDHKTYPNDIIVGAFWKRFKYDQQTDTLSEHLCTSETYGSSRFCGKIMRGFKPANGTGGTLYPPATFTDHRFFDKSLYMGLSGSSDETWQFCFNIIEHRTFRQLNMPFVDSFIEGSQRCAMNKNNGRYKEIYAALFSNFPEFKTNLIQEVI